MSIKKKKSPTKKVKKVTKPKTTSKKKVKMIDESKVPEEIKKYLPNWREIPEKVLTGNTRVMLHYIPDFTFAHTMRILRARYDSVAAADREFLSLWETDSDDALKLKEYLLRNWMEIPALTATEAFAEQNLEKRRIAFMYIGPEKVVKDAGGKVIDKQTITKSRTRWNEKLEPYQTTYDDTYELIEINSSKLFPGQTRGRSVNYYAVRCSCTTTQREYFIWVDENNSQRPNLHKDAIDAIAWTIHINIKNPAKIYRQGDIIISEPVGGVPEYCDLRPITKEEYLNLMVSET